jgi:cytochrome bd-type quinol oxidase subunit 1
MMSSLSKLLCGLILLTVPSIQYGGYYLLTLLSGQTGQELTDYQRSMFRAGHAHAGVLVILALVGQLLLDAARLPLWLAWVARLGFPLAAILVSAGFFAAAIGRGVTQPTPWIAVLYVGAGLLALAVILTGIGLLRAS